MTTKTDAKPAVEMITDEELEKVFKGTHYNPNKYREAVEKGILKEAAGKVNGKIVQDVLHRLQFIRVSKIDDPQTFPYAIVITITRKGKSFLYDSFKDR